MNIYIYRTPILMGMGVMSSGMQGGKTWGDRGGGGGEGKSGVNRGTIGAARTVSSSSEKKGKMEKMKKEGSSSPTRLSVSTKIVQVFVCVFFVFFFCTIFISLYTPQRMYPCVCIGVYACECVCEC
jgi:hypothetical protein